MEATKQQVSVLQLNVNLATAEGQRILKSQLVADIAENYYALVALDNKLNITLKYIELQKKGCPDSPYSEGSRCRYTVGCREI